MMNLRTILIGIFIVQIISSSILMYLGHYQHSSVLDMISKEEQKRASYVAESLFEKIGKEYLIHAREILKDPEVIDAFAQGDRERLLKLTGDDYFRLKQLNPYLVIMHFHTTDTHSFLRLHRPKKFGDDLSGLRPIIVQTNRMKEPLTGLEPGKYGIHYRITMPVFDGSRHIGVMEFGIDIRYLVTRLAEQSPYIPLLLIDNQAIQAIFENDKRAQEYLAPFSEAYSIIRYPIANEQFNEIVGIVDERSFNSGYYTTMHHGKEYLVFGANDIQNYASETIGSFVFIQDMEYYMDTIAVVRWISIITTVLLLSVTLALFYKWIRNYAERSLESQRKLSDLSNMLTNVLEGAALGYWDRNLKTHRHYVNDRWLEILGLERNDIDELDSDWSGRLHPDDKERILPLIEQAIRDGGSYRLEFRMLHKSGEYVWIEGSGSVVERDANGKAVRMSGTHQDITQRKILEAENERNRKYNETIFEKNPNIIIVTDGRDIMDANQKFMEFFNGFSDLDAFKQKHRCVSEMFSLVDDPDYLHPSRGNWVLQSIGSKIKKVLIERDGKAYYFSVHANQIAVEDEILYLATLTDITYEHNLQEELEHLTIIDPLTQLYNRRYFNEMFERQIKLAKRGGHPLTFMMIDIDNFKKYNDNYGHDKGDIVLERISKEMKSALKRPGDFLFRLGGEEFGILCSGITPEGARKYADEIRSRVEALQIEHQYNEPYGIETISIGLCCVDFGIHDFSIAQVYRKADEALYKAKNSGKNRVEGGS